MIDHDKLSFYCSRTCSVQIATLDSQVVFYIGKVRLTTDHLRFLCILEQMYHKTTKPPNNGSGHHESLWACNSCSIDTQYLHHISRFYASNMATTKYVLKYLIIFINIHTFITIVECILDIYIYIHLFRKVSVSFTPALQAWGNDLTLRCTMGALSRAPKGVTSMAGPQ